MRDFIELGPTPTDEESSQMGQENFYEMNKIECEVYRRQLQQMFPNVNFRTKLFPYEPEEYREVVVVFDDDNPESVDGAFRVEANLPDRWSDDAKRWLQELGYSI
jgi:hypothetical protein